MLKPRLAGKVALITGAASGIGAAAARLFSYHGASVVVADIQDDLARRLVSSINSDNVSFHHCDVRDELQVAATVAHAVAHHGGLDILFSNAGALGPLAGIMDLDIDSFDGIMATNVRGVAVTIKHAARAMVGAGTRGSIICTGSAAGSVGGLGPAAYTASKHAVVGLVRAACAELGGHGIRVNCVSPFGVATPLTCEAYGWEAGEVEARCSEKANLKGVVLTARHVAEAALFLASEESEYVSGLNLTVDGGVTVV